MSRTRHSLAVLLVVSASPACTIATPPTCDDTESAACFKGAMRSLLGQRLPDVEVCAPELEDIPCVTTDEEGTWKMPGLPFDTNVLVTATLEGTVHTVLPQTTSMSWYDWYKVMVPEGIMNTNARNLDATLDPERGNILFLAWEGLNIDGIDTANVSGVEVELLSGDGQVFYANALGLAAKAPTSTTASGSGGVLNLEPGLHSLRFSVGDIPCTEQMFHYAGEDGVIPVPVLAGHTTAIDVLCPQE